MARQMDFGKKIEVLESKIEKKQEELKKLKDELNSVKTKKASSDYKELVEYMEQNNLSAEEVLASIKGTPNEAEQEGLPDSNGSNENSETEGETSEEN